MAELTKDAKTQEAELKVKQADADAAMEVRDQQSLCSPRGAPETSLKPCCHYLQGRLCPSREPITESYTKPS